MDEVRLQRVVNVMQEFLDLGNFNVSSMLLHG